VLDRSCFSSAAAFVIEPMSREEVDAFFALGIALEAAWLPDDELRRAVAAGRVAQAISTSSLGTAETYSAAVEVDTSLDALRGSAIVVLPDQRAQPTPFEERVDDRDVDGVLWEPFRAEQLRCVLRAVHEERRADCSPTARGSSRSSRSAGAKTAPLPHART